MQGLDPRCTETGPPKDKATGPGIPDEDQGLRGTQDFVGFGTSCDSRLRRMLDFVGSRTSQKTGTLHTPDQDLILWCSLREHKLSG